jgi:serine/threonine protein kinase
MPGTVLSAGRYKIEKPVAAGGMGAVYLAIDTRFNRPCAVKEMLDEFKTEEERSQSVEWFSREATLLLDLNHPCIPRVRDFFAEGGKHYLVMDFIEGRTLGQVLEEEGKVVGVNHAQGVTEARAREWARQVCSVLAYLHKQNPPIIFRDLKPSNIMVATGDEVKLIDFGIARTFQSKVQATIIMTPGYAPPEQLGGRPEPRSDLYALGATIHKVLTRHDAANNQPNLFSFPPLRSLRPDITPAFEAVIMRALAPNLEQRWPSAADMERAIINLPPITVNPPIAVGGVAPTMTAPSSWVAPSGPHSGPASSSTTGPAGFHITAAQNHMVAKPPRFLEAYNEITRAHAIEPNNALVHKLFGQYYARLAPPQPQKAMTAYNRSIQINPNDAETHKLAGDVFLFLLNQPMEGIRAYVSSLRINANDAETRHRLGQCYEKTNQRDAALREFQEAARIAPRAPEIQFSLGNLASLLGQLPIAEQALVQVLMINPSDHRTRFLLCQVYERQGKFVDAFREARYVVQGPLGSDPAVQATFNRLRARQ